MDKWEEVQWDFYAALYRADANVKSTNICQIPQTFVNYRGIFEFNKVCDAVVRTGPTTTNKNVN